MFYIVKMQPVKSQENASVIITASQYIFHIKFFFLISHTYDERSWV